jgi:hypothetical protein
MVCADRPNADLVKRRDAGDVNDRQHVSANREEGTRNHADLHEEESIGMRDSHLSRQTDERIIRADSSDAWFLFFRGSGVGKGPSGLGKGPISSPSAGCVTVIGEALPIRAEPRGILGKRGPVPATGPEGPGVGTPRR